MKQALVPGAVVQFQVVVDESMRPAFDGEVVHDVMSTVSMIYHMERAGRIMILPYLQEGEEGAGFAIDVKHVGPAVMGQKVTFTAVCTEVTAKRVVCEVKAETEYNVVGLGMFTQAIFQKEEMDKRIGQLEQMVQNEKNHENH